MSEIEETKKEVLKILEDGFYPYLPEWEITENKMKLIMVLKDKLSLKEIIEKLHDSEMRIYHELKGTPIPDDSKYNHILYADDWQELLQEENK